MWVNWKLNWRITACFELLRPRYGLPYQTDGFPYFTNDPKTRYTKGMKVQEAMKKPTVSNLYSGEIVTAGYIRGQRNFTDANEFLGFKVGSLFFTNLKQLKENFGVSNMKELEFEAERLELGSVTAEFFNVDEQYTWAAYLWNGGFKVGSSADALKLATAA
jgi:hypothetical protein